MAGVNGLVAHILLTTLRSSIFWSANDRTSSFTDDTKLRTMSCQNREQEDGGTTGFFAFLYTNSPLSYLLRVENAREVKPASTLVHF